MGTKTTATNKRFLLARLEARVHGENDIWAQGKIDFDTHMGNAAVHLAEYQGLMDMETN